MISTVVLDMVMDVMRDCSSMSCMWIVALFLRRRLTRLEKIVYRPKIRPWRFGLIVVVGKEKGRDMRESKSTWKLIRFQQHMEMFELTL